MTSNIPISRYTDKTTQRSDTELYHFLGGGSRSTLAGHGPLEHGGYCTQPRPRTYTWEDTDSDGVLNIAIDASSRRKDCINSCWNCDKIGDQITSIVHGGCIELCRIDFDENDDGTRRIEGLTLDLRPQKQVPESEKEKRKRSDLTQWEVLQSVIDGNDIRDQTDHPEEPTSKVAPGPAEPSGKDVDIVKGGRELMTAFENVKTLHKHPPQLGGDLTIRVQSDDKEMSSVVISEKVCILMVTASSDNLAAILLTQLVLQREPQARGKSPKKSSHASQVRGKHSKQVTQVQMMVQPKVRLYL